MDEPIHNVLEPGSSDDSSQNMSQSSEILKISITDLVIKCSYDGLQQDFYDSMGIQVFGSAIVEENDVGILYLRKIDPNSWKYNGQIERLITDKGVTIVAQTGRGDPLGHVQITPELFGGLSALANRQLNHKFNCAFLTEAEAPALNLSLTITNDQFGQHLYQALYQASESNNSYEEVNAVVNDLFSVLSATLDGLENKFIMWTSIIDRLSSSFQHEDKIMALEFLAQKFISRFLQKQNHMDISIAISTYQKAIYLIPTGHANKSSQLVRLADAFWGRFQHAGDLKDISEAISNYQKALHLIPKGHPDTASCLSKLANAFSDRFEHTGDVTDILESISIYQDALHLTSEEDQDRAGQLSGLASAFSSHFDHTGNLSDICEAIATYQNALEITPEEPRQLGNLASAFLRRFQHTQNLTDISEAIFAYQRALHFTPEGDVRIPALLGNLASAFVRRFEQTENLTDISEAITTYQLALHLTPEGHLGMAPRLQNLATAFLVRYDGTKDLEDISEAISIYRKSLHLTPETHTRIHLQLSNLAGALHSRFDHTGDIVDISEAISIHQRAVQLTPKGHATMAWSLTKLANAFGSRFRHTRDPLDIAEAISINYKSLKLTPEGHGRIYQQLNSLANLFQAKFEHTGDWSAIPEALSIFQKALDLTPEGHHDRARQLSNFGNAYRSSFEYTKDLKDISKAIYLHQEAMNLTPKGHTQYPFRLEMLATGFSLQFYCTKDIADISKAISIYEDVINLIGKENARMGSYLSNLANSHYSCFKFGDTRDIKNLKAAVSYWSQSSKLTTSPPSLRLHTSKEWANSAKLLDPYQSLDAYNVAIELLSQVVGLDQTTHRRYANLQVDGISDLSMQAAAYACFLDCPDKAIEWLEQGRCLVWNQLNSLRSPLDKLNACHPDLAKDILKISQKLEYVASRPKREIEFTMEQKMREQDYASSHLKLAREREDLLAKIRDIPQFENFLRPQPCSDLFERLPTSGTVVVINVDDSRCDALALMHGLDGPLHIQLPDFTLKKADDLYASLQAGMKIHRLRDRGDKLELDERTSFVFPASEKKIEIKPIKVILAELWTLVVEPILKGIAYSSPHDELLHIWWCTTGPLALLPIHAAGIYSNPPADTPCTLADFAVSSYIPTVSALTTRVQNSLTPKVKKGLFMISQPNTPHQSRIGGTTKEVEAVEELLKPHNVDVFHLAGSSATVEKVKENMDKYGCIHFACHASQHPMDPLESAFYLQDGRLQLSTIIKKNLTGANLAFLSACQTSVGDERLKDEAVHLAAGMLAAGYQGVVATMWSIQDDCAPQVAQDFYANLMGKVEEGKQKDLDSTNAAFALHYAIQNLRKQIGDSELSLLIWVPYVHFGL